VLVQRHCLLVGLMATDCVVGEVKPNVVVGGAVGLMATGCGMVVEAEPNVVVVGGAVAVVAVVELADESCHAPGGRCSRLESLVPTVHRWW
jgi:hypothetical protein